MKPIHKNMLKNYNGNKKNSQVGIIINYLTFKLSNIILTRKIIEIWISNTLICTSTFSKKYKLSLQIRWNVGNANLFSQLEHSDVGVQLYSYFKFSINWNACLLLNLIRKLFHFFLSIGKSLEIDALQNFSYIESFTYPLLGRGLKVVWIKQQKTVHLYRILMNI